MTTNKKDVREIDKSKKEIPSSIKTLFHLQYLPIGTILLAI
jgi:hypothetical protein